MNEYPKALYSSEGVMKIVHTADEELTVSEELGIAAPPKIELASGPASSETAPQAKTSPKARQVKKA